MTPMWLVVAHWVCLLIYSVDLGARVFVERIRVFNGFWNWLDIIVVSTGYMTGILDVADVSVANVGFLRVFRCFRLIRIMKAFTFMNHVGELKKLVMGVVVVLKTLIWALLLVFIFMTIWACLAVEMLHPLMEEVSQTSAAWDDCERCVRSFGSIMSANLTFFQTIIAGDSWGLVAIPVTENYPLASVIFIGSLFSVVA